MTTDPEIEPSLEAATLNDAARAEALVISEWCDARADEAAALADRQFAMVGWLLLGGLLLLLFLPRIVQEIDYLGREASLPPKIVETANATAASIAENREEMWEEKEAAAKRLAETKERLDRNQTALEEQEAEIRRRLSAPHMMWKPVSDDYAIPILALTGGGAAIAIGNPPEGQTRRPEIVLIGNDSLRKADLAPLPEAFGPAGFMAVLVNNTTVLAIPERVGEIWRSKLGSRAWERVWPNGSEKAPFGGFGEILRSTSGRLVASGWMSPVFRSTGSIEEEFFRVGPTTPTRGLDRQLLLTSDDDGLTWTPITDRQPDILSDGGLWGGTMRADGSFVFVGRELSVTGDNEPERTAVVLTSPDGETWEKVYPTLGGVALDSLRYVVETEDGALIGLGNSVTSDNEAFISGDGREWRRTDGSASFPDLRIINDAELGTVMIGRRASDPVFLEYRSETQSWTPLANFSLLSFGGVFGDFRALPGPRLLVSTELGVLSSLTADEGAPILDGLIESGARSDVLLSEASIRLLRNQREVSFGVETLRQNFVDQEAFLETTLASFERQDNAIESFGDVTAELENALRASEPARQLAQIATRLAVIALIVYLVQIVVNRYRYLQRLTGFYRARAQSLRILAAQPEGAFLKGFSVGDLTDMLSPDGIGFDKSAEPPTNQMVSLLQAGLKKT